MRSRVWAFVCDALPGRALEGMPTQLLDLASRVGSDPAMPVDYADLSGWHPLVSQRNPREHRHNPDVGIAVDLRGRLTARDVRYRARSIVLAWGDFSVAEHLRGGVLTGLLCISGGLLAARSHRGAGGCAAKMGQPGLRYVRWLAAVDHLIDRSDDGELGGPAVEAAPAKLARASADLRRGAGPLRLDGGIALVRSAAVRPPGASVPPPGTDLLLISLCRAVRRND
jgi:hypothetical protein